MCVCVCVCVCVRACVFVYMSYFKNHYKMTTITFIGWKNMLANDNTLPNESIFKTRGNEKERTPL